VPTPEPTPTPEPPPAPEPPPTPPPAEPGSTVRLLHWNIHHGIGTDGILNFDRIAAWIVAINPNLISLNEVDDQESADALRALIEQRTGEMWFSAFSGRGNHILTRLPVQSSSLCAYNAEAGRYAPHVGAVVGGRLVNFWSAHLAVDSGGTRAVEVAALQGCASQWPEARLMAGDFNMQSSSGEYAVATATYVDAWDAARAMGTTINYSGNCDGCTRNSRIDYVFASQGASWLRIESAQVFDTRDASGYMPSDHKPMLVVYQVR
jgi:endonuclease/exonuclease/phosphatase family metal-dependent hydrolase